MMMLNPYILGGIVCLVIASFFEGIHYKSLEDQAEIAKLNEQARLIEQQRVQDANDHATKLRQANAQADKTISKLKSDVASGELRLSIARAVPSASDSASAARVGNETRCDIDPTAAQSIVTIAADGDKAIRQLNELIDFYNQLKGKK
jgi:small-conductance mechanosensitive channel